MRLKKLTACFSMMLSAVFFLGGYFSAGSAGVWAAEGSSLSFIPPGRYMLVKERSRAAAFVRSTLHDLDAVASLFTGELVIPPGGTLKDVRFHFEFKTEDLDTGNFLRDGAMHELALEVEKYPKAVFDARSVRFSRKDKTGWQYEVIGDFSIHGVKKEVTTNVKVRKEGGNYLLTGKFTLLLFGYKIVAPSLPCISVEDVVEVKIQLSFRPAHRAKTPEPGIR